MPACSFCEADGELHLEECRDLHYGVEGSWNYWKCPACSSLWMHPLPAAGEIPRFYPCSYDFIRKPAASTSIPANTLRDRVKRRLLERVYGYPSLPGRRSCVDRAIARALARFSLGSIPSGFQVGFAPYICGGQLLEVGSGNGDFLARMEALGWNVQGLEPDPGAVHCARSRGLEVTEGVLEESSLEPGSFDVVFMHHVFEHLLDPRKSIAKIWATLKAGGLFVSVSPNPESATARYFGPWWSALQAPRHLHLPTREGYRRLLTAEGFDVVCLASNRLLAPLIAESVAVAPSLKRAGLRRRLLWRNVTARMGGEEVISIARKR